MNRNVKMVISGCLLVAVALCLGGALEAQSGQAARKAGQQTGRKKTTTGRKSRAKTAKSTRTGASTKTIDVKVQRFQASFLREAAELARQYEDAGNLVKARQMLELILKLSPEVKGVRAKIKQIDEEMLSANELTADVDAARGWGQPVAAVFKGQPFRIQAGGDYRFVTNLPIGPAGFSVADAGRDMAAGIRCGALIGVVVPPPESGKQLKPGKPFLVGAGGTITPRETGLLFLKINAPAGHKSNGRLKVRMTGSVRKP
jgi:hypothetical protein